MVRINMKKKEMINDFKLKLSVSILVLMVLSTLLNGCFIESDDSSKELQDTLSREIIDTLKITAKFTNLEHNPLWYRSRPA